MGAKFEQLPGKWSFRGSPGRLPAPLSRVSRVASVLPDQSVANGPRLGFRLVPEQVC